MARDKVTLYFTVYRNTDDGPETVGEEIRKPVPLDEDDRVTFAYDKAMEYMKKHFELGGNDLDLRAGLTLKDATRVKDDESLSDALEAAAMDQEDGVGGKLTVFALEKPRALTPGLSIRGSAASAEQASTVLAAALARSDDRKGSESGSESDGSSDSGDGADAVVTSKAARKKLSKYEKRVITLSKQALKYGNVQKFAEGEWKDTGKQCVVIETEHLGALASSTPELANGVLYARCNHCSKRYKVTVSSVAAAIDAHMKKQHDVSIKAGGQVHASQRALLLASTVAAKSVMAKVSTPKTSLDVYEIVHYKAGGDSLVVFDENDGHEYSKANGEFGRLKFSGDLKAGDRLVFTKNGTTLREHPTPAPRRPTTEGSGRGQGRTGGAKKPKKRKRR